MTLAFFDRTALLSRAGIRLRPVASRPGAAQGATPSPAPGPDASQPSPAAARRRIEAAAAALPPEEQTLFDLWIHLDFDDARISALTLISPVAVRIHRDGIVALLARELGIPRESVSATLAQTAPASPSIPARLSATAVRTSPASGTPTADPGPAMRQPPPPGELLAQLGRELGVSPTELRCALVGVTSQLLTGRADPVAPGQPPNGLPERNARPTAGPNGSGPAGARGGASPLSQASPPTNQIVLSPIHPDRGGAPPPPPSPSPSPSLSPSPSPSPSPGEGTTTSGGGDVTPPPPPQRRPRRRIRWWILGVVTVAVAAGATAIATRSDPATYSTPGPVDARGQALAGVSFESPSANAQAQVTESRSSRSLVLQTHGLTELPGGRYEVWLYNSAQDAEPLGSLRAGAGAIRYALPSTAARYRSIHVTFRTARAAGQAQVLALSGANPARRIAARRLPRAGERSASARLAVPQPTWSDEFSGSSLRPRNWLIVTGAGGHGNNDLEDYARPNVRVSGGDLLLTAQRSGDTITSGAVDSLGKVSARYGLIEANIEAPKGAGLWPTFWLEGTDLPSVGWPASGEIDAMEILLNDDNANDGSIHTTSSTGAPVFEHKNVDPCSCDLTAGFHTYGIDWSPNRIQFMLDGRVYATETRAAVEAQGGGWTFNKPFFILLTLAVGGTGDGNPTASTPFPATLRVNWVRVYPNL